MKLGRQPDLPARHPDHADDHHGRERCADDHADRHRRGGRNLWSDGVGCHQRRHAGAQRRRAGNLRAEPETHLDDARSALSHHRCQRPRRRDPRAQAGSTNIGCRPRRIWARARTARTRSPCRAAASTASAPKPASPGRSSSSSTSRARNSMCCAARRRRLRETCGLLIECPVRAAGGPQFIDIYGFLAERGFSLFDIVRLSHRGSDATLYQFYAVFIAERFDFRGKNLAAVRRAAGRSDRSGHRAPPKACSPKAPALIASIKLKRAMG